MGLLGLMLLALLTLATWIFVYSKLRLDVPAAFVVSVTGVACMVLFVVEFVSFLSALTFWTASALSLILAAALIWVSRHEFEYSMGRALNEIRWKRYQVGASPGNRMLSLAVGLLAVGLALVVASGFLIAPSNWDSLSYHLPRTLHWLQQGSLAYFETSYEPQNTYPPLPSAIQVLLVGSPPSGQLSFIPQFLSGLVLAAAVAQVARALSPKSSGLLALIFVLSIPLITIMLSTTQSDLVAALPVALGLVSLRLIWQGRSRLAVVLAAISVGIAPAIKITALLFAFPVAVVVLVIALRSDGKWRRIRDFAVGLIVATIAVSTPYLIRYIMGLLNQSETGIGQSHLNSDFSLGNISSSWIEFVGFLLYLPVDSWNAQLSQAIDSVRRAAGAPAFPGYVQGWGDSNIGAPLHLAIVVLALVLLTFQGRWNSRAFQILGICVTQVLLISIFIEWNPWFERFVVVPLAISGSLVAFALAPHGRLARSAVALLAAFFVSFAAIAPDRGLLGTSFLPPGLGETLYPSPLKMSDVEQMGGIGRRNEIKAFANAAFSASQLGPDAVLLCFGPDEPEFVLWKILKRELPDIRIMHIGEVSLREVTGIKAVVLTGPGCDVDSLPLGIPRVSI